MNFKKEADVTSEWIDYIKAESISLSQLDEFALERYIDTEVLNPELVQFLDTWEDEATTSSYQTTSTLSLGFTAEMSAREQSQEKKFKRLKNEIHKIVCDVLTSITDPDTKLEDIIKIILLACISAFATGLPALLLPFIIVLVAKILRKGIARLCGE